MAKKYVNYHVGCDYETSINSKHEHGIYFNIMLLMDYNNQLIILSLLCRRYQLDKKKKKLMLKIINNSSST